MHQNLRLSAGDDGSPKRQRRSVAREMPILGPAHGLIDWPQRIPQSAQPIGHQDVLPDAFTLHGPGGSETAPPW
jgi:hypothetical protein